MDWYMCDTCVALNMYFKTVWPFQTAICLRKCPETSRSTTGFHATPWKLSLVWKECPQFCKLWVWNPLTSCCWDQDADMKQHVSYLGCLLYPTTDSSQQTTDNRQHTGNTDQGLVNSWRRHETQRNTHANAQQRHTTTTHNKTLGMAYLLCTQVRTINTHNGSPNTQCKIYPSFSNSSILGLGHDTELGVYLVYLSDISYIGPIYLYICPIYRSADILVFYVYDHRHIFSCHDLQTVQ